MTIHVRTWPGSGSATVTDMTHAGKRGRKCRTLRISGAPSNWNWPPADEAQRLAARHTVHVLHTLENLDGKASFEDARETVRDLIAEARQQGVPLDYLTSYDEVIRGIDAPRPRLMAGVPGVWSGYADETGIHLSDDADQHNMPAEVTHKQTEAAAYSIACKVWDRVQKAATMPEASSLLTAAGARLHYWCRMD